MARPPIEAFAAGLLALVCAGPAAAEAAGARAGTGGTTTLAGFEAGTPYPGLDTVHLRSPWHPPTYVTGVDGRALRFDGYSTYVEGRLTRPVAVPATLSFDVAVWSWPVAQAGLVVIHGPPRIAVTLNQWGRLVATAETPAGRLQVVTPEPITRDAWQRVAVVLEGAAGDAGAATGGLSLHLDGRRVGRDRGGAVTRAAGAVTLGLNRAAGKAHGAYRRGVFNGALDRVRLAPGAAGADALEADAARARRPATDLRPPPSRFADDPHRPLYHPMPPAGWTNEPHGLIHTGGTWRLWYQANPNGPWWDHMQWGALTSEDLGRWQGHRTALWPTPGFDRAGVWVGDVIAEDGGLRAFYTGVNGQWAGIGAASAPGDDSADFRKHRDNPLIVETPPGYQEMRDPFLVRRADDWLMLVGGGRLAPKVPTLLTYVSRDLENWTFAGELDVGPVARFGEYWELPKLLDFGDRHALLVTTVNPGTPARTQYWLGRFDGDSFVPRDPQPRELDLFDTHLAQATHSMGDGRFAAVGIVPETNRTTQQRLRAGWIHGFSLARTIALAADGDRLVQRPAAGVDQLFGEPAWRASGFALDGRPRRLGDLDAAAARVTLKVDPGQAREVTVALRATPDLAEASRLRFFTDPGRVALDFSDSSATPGARSDILWSRDDAFASGEAIDLTLFVDRSFVDGFLANGNAFAFRTFPRSPEATGVYVSADGAGARVLSATITPFGTNRGTER